jgi:hypothetical protein
MFAHLSKIFLTPGLLGRRQGLFFLHTLKMGTFRIDALHNQRSKQFSNHNRSGKGYNYLARLFVGF